MMRVIRKAVKRSLDRALQTRGYIIQPIGNSVKKIKPEDVEDFKSIIVPIQRDRRTLLGTDRLYILWQSVRRALVIKGDLAEIGVFKGGSAKLILSTMNSLNERRDVFLFDTFEGMPNLQKDVDHREKGGFEDTSAESVRGYLSAFPQAHVLKGMFHERSGEAAARTFCFAHIDVDIYQSFRDCFNFFAPRLSVGGILLLDDYGFKTCPGARRAADEFLAANNGSYHLFHLETGQAIMVRFA